MAKTYRISFEKGVNVIGDKPILPDGFATILDNVDLRSGSARPFRAPEYKFQAPVGTTRSWEYRGRWFHSASWRDYVGQYIGAIERVYWTEQGDYPRMSIEGNVLPGSAVLYPLVTIYPLLSNPRPQTVLGVTATTNLVPPSVSAVTSLGGDIPVNTTYYYRVAAQTADGILPASPATSATTPAAVGYYQNALTWGAVDGALSYIVFRGIDSASCYQIVSVPGSTLSFVDSGAVTSTSNIASQFDQTQPFSYAYTYVRSISGVLDESGMSFNTADVTASQGRLITRDVLNDGFFTQNTVNTGGVFSSLTQSITGAITNQSLTDFPPINLLGATLAYNNYLNQTTITTTLAHGLLTNDKVQLQGFTDVNWNNLTFTVVYISATSFAIQELALPSDVSPLTTGHQAQPIKSLIAYSNTVGIIQDDAVFVVGTGISGLYRATPVDSTHFSIPVLNVTVTNSVTLKWVPGNGFYRYWNIYRNENGGWFLVNQCDIWDNTFTDAKPFAALGGTPSSFYSENGQPVDYDVPPFSLGNLTEHYGMLFGTVGNTVRWTPILAPTAWPETFSITFPYKPVALASYAQGLIVLCQDSLYRIDGNTATGLSVSKTLTEDGCIAPHSVQKTQSGLFYLSRRGVMIFDGQQSRCITDMKLPDRFLNGPSTLPSPTPFWWFLTTTTRNYNDLAGEGGIKGSEYNWTLDNTLPIDGVINGIKSFYYLGKYYLFYTGANYQANTCICIDLQLEGLPITTLGMKALDAHVSDTEIPYVLMDNSAPVTTVIITSPV